MLRGRGRELLVYGVLLLTLAGLLGFGWLTRNPGAPILERAQEWPLVGPLAQRFRRAYLGPEPAPVEAGGQAPEEDEPIRIVLRREIPGPGMGPAPGSGASAEPVERQPEGSGPREAEDRGGGEAGREPPTLGLERQQLTREPGDADIRIITRSRRPASEPGAPAPPPLLARTYEYLWLHPGTELREKPEASAPVAGRLARLSCLPADERRRGWVRVRYRGRELWAAMRDGEPVAPPLGELSRPPRWLDLPPTDERRLGAARYLLGLAEPSDSLGPFPLYTDVADGALLEILAGAASRLETTYKLRYGMRPLDLAKETVVLFRDAATLRAIYADDERVAAMGGLHGFAGSGFASLFAAGVSRWEVAGTLIHELTHLVNRRALGNRLPPWLDEGLASDMSFFELEDPAIPVPGAVAYDRGSRRYQLQREAAELLGLDQAFDRGEAPPVPELMELDYRHFYRGDVSLNYDTSAFFVRYLMEGEDGALASGFRDFLRRVVGGRSATPKALAAKLARSWEEIQTGFEAYVRREAKRLRETLGYRE